MFSDLAPALPQIIGRHLLEKVRVLKRKAVSRLRALGSRFPTGLPADQIEHLAGPTGPAIDPGPTCGRPQAQGSWREETLQAAAVPQALRHVEAALEVLGYSERDRFAVRLALDEALANALKHGNRGDPAKCVRLCWRVTPECVLAKVEDEGEGFDPAAVPDPRDPENLERSCGRGLLLMRHYMDEVRYHGRGNRVTLGKRRWPA
jgi:serine/threonine-protein kinase RsbW